MKVTGPDNSNLKKVGLGNTANPANTAKAAEKGKAAYASNAAQAKEAVATPQAAQGATEKILVSDLGREVAKIHDQIKKSPNVRAEKVAELKQKVDNGTYYVSSDKIANKIIEDIVKNA